MSTGTASSLKFLAGGGEMGALIRAKDWSQTPLGSPETWPQSLRTSVSMLLNSRFPMFLWWGDHLIQFYNDAYRPSLGHEGKHPAALGQRGVDCWPEIWPTIKPLIDQVWTTREATWSEDQLIPIYRNGRLEDVYWTFSYSAVPDESGQVGGVLVVCQETTQQVLTLQRLKEGQQELRNLFEQAPVAIGILRGPTFVVELANPGMCEIWNRSHDALLGKPIFEVLTEAAGQGFEELLTGVLETGVPFVGNELPVTLMRGGQPKTVYINFVYTPQAEAEGRITGITVVATDVTEQVLARQKIEESESRFRQLADSMPQMVWSTLADGYHDFYNQRWYHFTGLTYEQTKAEGWANVLHPGDYNRTWTVWRDSLETGKIYEIEYRMRRHDGEYVWQLGRALPVRDAAGVIVRWYGTCTDISEQKQAQAALRESDRWFRQLADSMPQIVWTARPDGFLDYFNQRWYEYLGGDQGYGDAGWLPILHPDDRQPCLDHWQHCLQTGEPYRFEFRLDDPRKPGIYHWFLALATAFRDERGAIVKWFGTCTDIDEQKKSQSALRESEGRFRAVADTAPVLIWMAGTDKLCYFFNKGWLNFTGRTMEQELGNGWAEGVHPEDFDRCLEVYTTNFDARREFYMEYRLRRHDGGYRWITDNGVPRYAPDGSFLGYIGGCIDIHDQKNVTEQLEILVRERTEALEQANLGLQRTNLNLSQFAYVASHDLQEPLRKITAFGDMLLKRNAAQLDESGADRIRRMQDAAERMGGLIRDLLDYSRVSSYQETFAPVNLDEIFKSVRSDLAVPIREKKASLRAEALPTVKGDATQLRQVLQNLLSNALKFSHPDVPPVVEIRCRVVPGTEAKGLSLAPDALFYEISVSDNGIGFDPQYAERIFEAFQRLHGRADYPGTGIGLAIVRKVAENHHGAVAVHSALGEGSTFRVYLPVGEGVTG